MNSTHWTQNPEVSRHNYSDHCGRSVSTTNSHMMGLLDWFSAVKLSHFVISVSLSKESRIVSADRYLSINSRKNKTAQHLTVSEKRAYSSTKQYIKVCSLSSESCRRKCDARKTLGKNATSPGWKRFTHNWQTHQSEDTKSKYPTHRWGSFDTIRAQYYIVAHRNELYKYYSFPLHGT